MVRTIVLLSLVAISASVRPSLEISVPTSRAIRPAVSINELRYEGVYTPSQPVKIWSGVAASIEVRGSLVDQARAVEIERGTGGAATGMSVSITSRAAGRLTVRVSSTASADVATDYKVKIRYPLEPTGPDAFFVRLYDRGSITGLSISDGTANALEVGKTYTLVVSGSKLDRVACCSGTLAANSNISVTSISRSGSSASFALVLKKGYPFTIKADNFHDRSLTGAVSTPGLYAGSGSIDVHGVRTPIVSSVSPSSASPGALVTLSGTNLTPADYSAEIVYLHKYQTGNLVPATLSNGTVQFRVVEGMRPDSIRLQYSTAAPGAENIKRVVTVPPIYVKAMPKIAGVGATIQVNSATERPLLKPGTQTITGQDLLNYAPLSTSTLSGSTSGVTKTAVSGASIAVASPSAPSVSFGGTPLTVTSAVYDRNGRIDRVTVTVPEPAANQSAALTVTTSAGTGTLSNVYHLQPPRVTKVLEYIGNGTYGDMKETTLRRGKQYAIVGTGIRVIVNQFLVADPVVKINQTHLPVSGSVSASGETTGMNGTSVVFTVSSTATSGPLTLTTPVGTVTAGTFTVSDAPVAPTISSVLLAPTTVGGGSATTATVAFSTTPAAGSKLGDITVWVPSADQAVIPPIAAIPITANPLTFQIPTNAVTTLRTVTLAIGISALNATSSTKNVTLTVTPPQPTAVVLSPTALTGGQTANGVVQLNGSAPSSLAIPVSMSSNDPSVTVTPNVTINGSSAVFSVTTTAVSQPKTVTITATTGGTSRSATLTVNPATLTALSFTPVQVVSGKSSSGTITFSGPVSGQTVAVETDLVPSSQWARLLSNSVTANGSSASFQVLSYASEVERTITVKATFGGVTKTASFTIIPLTQSLSFAPGTLVAGSQTTGTVRLNVASPEVLNVELTSSDPSVASIPAGTRQFNVGQDVLIFPVNTTAPQAQSKTVTITAKISRTNVPAAYPAPVVNTVTATLIINP